MAALINKTNCVSADEELQMALSSITNSSEKSCIDTIDLDEIISSLENPVLTEKSWSRKKQENKLNSKHCAKRKTIRRQ
jgi:hypothetical protein